MSHGNTIADMLALEQVDTRQYLAQNLPGPSPVVFGGQILAQTVMAADLSVPDKELKSLHTVFARGGLPDQPLEIHVEMIQSGRTFASLNLSVRQGDRLCCQSIALLHQPEPDLIRYGIPAPSSVASPDATPAGDGGHSWWDARIVDNIDIMDPDKVGPPELNVWSRFSDVPDGLAASQAMLAFASDGFLIATAMRPHKGVGQAQAHVSISTSVVAQTLSFHDPFRADEWHLLAHESPYAGRGRTYGRACVFTEDGAMVASYTQENMVRDLPEAQRPPPGERNKY